MLHLKRFSSLRLLVMLARLITQLESELLLARKLLLKHDADDDEEEDEEDRDDLKDDLVDFDRLVDVDD